LGSFKKYKQLIRDFDDASSVHCHQQLSTVSALLAPFVSSPSESWKGG
jgi:hypothetical protein